MVLSVYLDRPAILTEVAPAAQVLLANFGALDQALFDVMSSRSRPVASCPSSCPPAGRRCRTSTQTWRRLREPLYPYGAGLAY